MNAIFGLSFLQDLRGTVWSPLRLCCGEKAEEHTQLRPEATSSHSNFVLGVLLSNDGLYLTFMGTTVSEMNGCDECMCVYKRERLSLVKKKEQKQKRETGRER